MEKLSDEWLRSNDLPTFFDIHQFWSDKGNIQSREILSGIADWKVVIDEFWKNYTRLYNLDKTETRELKTRIYSGERTRELYDQLVHFMRG